MQRKLDPTFLIIFGITGELSRQRLLPAIYRLFEQKLLPKKFTIIGFARKEFNHQTLRNYVKPPGLKKTWDKFAQKIFYHRGDITSSKSFQNLADFLKRRESPGHSCANRLFYFATLPSHYFTISYKLHKAGLLVGCRIHKRQTRVVIEKPFGWDLKSAQKLDRALNKYFLESQIYRIDHYLGKETVQNLLTVRFANSIFEPIWNRNFIDHVQISALEEVGIGNRGAYYDQAGALRDVVQNHLMQLLALIAMEQPSDLTIESIRNERVKVIRQIRPPFPAELKKFLVTGQYEGYQEEPSISTNSKTETFAALKLFIQNQRWDNVPFYLRTGKHLTKKITQISIHFKPSPLYLFKGQTIIPNVLIFEIHPQEGLFLNLAAKYPGFGIRLHPVTMELGYHSAFQGEFPEAYERLLLDFMEGDQRLFARSDEIEYAWKYIDVLEKYLSKTPGKSLLYKQGSSGPKEAEALITRDHRAWQMK